VVFLYVIFALSLLGLLAAGILEQRRHLESLRSIPVRILVNGTRGKSSITRLCAGALRGGSLRVVAKTTGTAPRVIWPDGTETPVHRKFDTANVIEQIGIVRQAAAEVADVLVMECMAVQPSLQELNQTKLIRSTIGVLSNVRDDHLEEMGPTLDDVARSLSRSMPEGGVCITAEWDRYHIVEAEAVTRGCRRVYADPESVSDDEIAAFDSFTFKENVAIALAVAYELGVGREEALRGMWAAAPDPGALTVQRYRIGGKSLRLANLFAANDPSSTVMTFERLLEGDAIRPPIFTLINCRPDRVERNRQMGTIVDRLLTEKLFVVGQPSRSATAAVPVGFGGGVTDLGGDRRDPGQILSTIMREVEDEASLVAVGNIHGQGERLLEHLEGLGAR
jgi:poly-gamma-glutamate synthase PgsB/CapB